jgi:hypothetical protein
VNEMSAAKNQTAVLILGMHRSGTSAVTRTLNLLGVELGDNLLDPQPDNRNGFWEHHDAVQIHERLLAELGRNWHDLRELPEGWLDHPAALRAVDEIAALIRKDFADTRLWAVKDPRMCRLAPLWLLALKSLDVRAVALIVVRDPREVAESLHVRDGWSHRRAWLMWLQHVFESIRVTEHVPRAMLTYDDLMTDWESNLVRIGTELDLVFPTSVEAVGRGIGSFLNPVDRHHKANAAPVSQDSTNQPPVLLLRLMDLCSQVTVDKSKWHAITALLDDYGAHAALFSGPIAELTNERNTFEQASLERTTTIEQVRNEIAAHSAALQSKMAALDGLNNELENLRRDHQEALNRYDELLSQHSDLQLQHRELTAMLQGQLERARFVTRSRRWLFIRFLQMTFRKSAVEDREWR